MKAIGKESTLVSVSVNIDGFTFDGATVPWSSVRAIAAYKHDLWAYDEICLAFKVSEDSWIEVSEEEPGFRSLVEEMERRFPDMPGYWFHEVMHPAFSTNYRLLWGM
ncbi:MAG TPA: hypothetical protein VM510_15250 [Caulifigura sp.]|nr:hypothetical protein [Caulifigura sp.]